MTTIEGVLETDSAILGAGRTAFVLKPWRQVDREWEKKAIRVVFPPGARSWRGGDAVRVVVSRLAKAGPNRSTDFVATGMLPVRRVKLSAVAAPAPKKIVDRVLGTLSPEQAFGWYSTWRKQCEVTIAVADLSDRAACEAAIAKGRGAILATEKRRAKPRAAIATKLVPLYNKRWREGGAELTAAVFVKALELVSIGVERSGAVNVIFECGEWFADHGVAVRICARGTIREIGLA